jgi:hydroxymethylglutaryl-CoA lyase
LNTGIDFERLLELRAKLEEWLPGERIEGRLKQAGLAKTFLSAA